MVRQDPKVVIDGIKLSLNDMISNSALGNPQKHTFGNNYDQCIQYAKERYETIKSQIKKKLEAGEAQKQLKSSVEDEWENTEQKGLKKTHTKKLDAINNEIANAPEEEKDALRAKKLEILKLSSEELGKAKEEFLGKHFTSVLQEIKEACFNKLESLFEMYKDECFFKHPPEQKTGLTGEIQSSSETVATQELKTEL